MGYSVADIGCWRFNGIERAIVSINHDTALKESKKKLE
jgi:hypothetical protein